MNESISSAIKRNRFSWSTSRTASPLKSKRSRERFYVSNQPRGSVLVLSDFTGASFDPEAIRTIKETAVFDKLYIAKSSLVGAGNLSDVLGESLRDSSRREFRTFKTRQEAVSWLVGNE